jgi:hypothetical protein
MSFGSVSTMSPWQNIYAGALMNAMQPWIGKTNEALGGFSSSPQSAYEAGNFDQFIQNKYIAPAQYSLRQRLADMQGGSERFSFGRQYNEMLARNQVNQGLGANISNELMNERRAQMGNETNALSRQLQALQIQGQDIFAPLKVRAVENSARPVSLFESLLK